MQVIDDKKEEVNHVEEEIKKVIESAEKGKLIFVLNEDATFHYFNEEWREELGFKEKDIIGEEYFSFIHPKDLPEMTISFIKVIQTGESIANIGPYRIEVQEDEDTNITENDTEKQYLSYIATILPIKDENGNVVKIVGVHKDITEDIKDQQSDEEQIKEEQEDDYSGKIIRNIETEEEAGRMVVEMKG